MVRSLTGPLHGKKTPGQETERTSTCDHTMVNLQSSTISMELITTIALNVTLKIKLQSSIAFMELTIS